MRTTRPEHNDFSPLYALHPQSQVVLSVNMVADGVLWCCPTTNGHTGAKGMVHKSIEWAWNNLGRVVKDMSLYYYLPCRRIRPL